MRVLKRQLLACVLLLCAGMVQAQQESESWLGLPVTYKDRSYTFAPWPAIEVRDMKIDTAQPILIDRALVTPDWGDWITEFKTQRIRLHANQVTASPSALLRLSIIDGKSTRKITVLKFDSLNLLIGNTRIVLPAGEIDFAADGTLAHLKVVLEQGLSFDVTPKGGKLALLVQAGSWKWSALPALLFTSLVAEGELTNDAIILDTVTGSGDGGTVRGNMRFAVSDRFDMTGELRLDSIQAATLLSRAYPRQTVQGILAANVKLSSSGDTLGDIGKDLSVNGSYSIRGGSVDRFGLLEGMRKSGGGAAGGGLTRFDTLSGTVSRKAGQPLQLSVQRLDAGALQGSGSANIAPEGTLKGNFSGRMRLPGGETSSRAFSITGTVDSPTLMLSN